MVLEYREASMWKMWTKKTQTRTIYSHSRSSKRKRSNGFPLNEYISCSLRFTFLCVCTSMVYLRLYTAMTRWAVWWFGESYETFSSDWNEWAFQIELCLTKGHKHVVATILYSRYVGLLLESGIFWFQWRLFTCCVLSIYTTYSRLDCSGLYIIQPEI